MRREGGRQVRIESREGILEAGDLSVSVAAEKTGAGGEEMLVRLRGEVAGGTGLRDGKG